MNPQLPFINWFAFVPSDEDVIVCACNNNKLCFYNISTNQTEYSAISYPSLSYISFSTAAFNPNMKNLAYAL